LPKGYRPDPLAREPAAVKPAQGSPLVPGPISSVLIGILSPGSSSDPALHSAPSAIQSDRITNCGQPRISSRPYRSPAKIVVRVDGKTEITRANRSTRPSGGPEGAVGARQTKWRRNGSARPNSKT